MPAAVPLTYRDFREIEKWCLAHGFVEIRGREIIRLIWVHGLVCHRRRVFVEGEIGFKFFQNGLTVKVWTTCLRSKVEQCRREPLISDDIIVSRPPGEDMGWVVIANEFGRAQYFARPTMRTKNFVQTFIQRIGITTRKVQNRPLCEKCRKWMRIFRKPTRATFWACLRKKEHEDGQPFWRGWDFALTARMLVIVNAWRKEFHRYLNAERAKGNDPQPAAQIRKRWVATNHPYSRQEQTY